MGFATYFLGIELDRHSRGIHLHQRKYILDLLNDVGIMGARSTTTPLPKGLKLLAAFGSVLLDLAQYRRLVGQLLNLNFTRPDITYIVQQLSQFVSDPCKPHWDVAVHLLKYLKGSPSKGIFSLCPILFTLLPILMPIGSLALILVGPSSTFASSLVQP